MDQGAPARVSSIAFKNYKGLRAFTLHLHHVNILVGPNNCGKSTVLGALRVLHEALRQARNKPPERVPGRTGDTVRGYRIREELTPISLENIHTNYEDVDTHVTFTLSNGNRLSLVFPSDGGAFLSPEGGLDLRSWGAFAREFPIAVAAVPVLGPMERSEESVTKETVQRGLNTHRASRHFRNYWRHYPDDFERFSETLSTTWPGMSIARPEFAVEDRELHMFCKEDRIDRELFWSGFGFQIWCQLLTHLIRLRNTSLVLVDEPDIYLHADLQRRLLSLLRDAAPSVVLATHSAEIIGEADPGEIVLIDKKLKHAQRLRDIDGVQSVLDVIGSTQNLALARLARSRRVVFVEGSDFKLIRRFAKKLGYREVAEGADIVDVPMEGFTHWDRIASFSWGLQKTLGGRSLELAVILDRDFRSPEEVSAIEKELSPHVAFCHTHSRKELENYLLVPPAISRALDKRLDDRPSKAAARPIDPAAMLLALTEPWRDELLSQFLARRSDYLRGHGDKRDVATINKETIASFNAGWTTLEDRLQIVPGKRAFATLNTLLQGEYGCSVTANAVIDAMRVTDVSDDMNRLVEALEAFRQRSTKGR